MLDSSFNFYQCFSGHIYIAKLNHSDEFCLFNSFFQPDLAYIRTNAVPRLFYLLFHGTPSEKELCEIPFLLSYLVYYVQWDQNWSILKTISSFWYFMDFKQTYHGQN